MDTLYEKQSDLLSSQLCRKPGSVTSLTELREKPRKLKVKVHQSDEKVVGTKAAGFGMGVQHVNCR